MIEYLLRGSYRKPLLSTQITSLYLKAVFISELIPLCWRLWRDLSSSFSEESEKDSSSMTCGMLKETECFLSCTCLIFKTARTVQLQLWEIHPPVLERKVELTVI